MNKILMGLMSIALLAGSTLANAGSLESFNYNSSSAGVTANFTVDVLNNLAQSGTGTVSFNSGVYGLTLLTASSILPSGNGGINPTPGYPSYDLGSGFTWHGVTGSGGADFMGDSVVNSTPNYFDDYSLIWEVTNQSTNAIVGGLNIWANTNTPASLYATNLSINGTNVFQSSGNGTFTVAAVPEPGEWMLMLCGLCLVGYIATRRKNDSSDMLMAA